MWPHDFGASKVDSLKSSLCFVSVHENGRSRSSARTAPSWEINAVLLTVPSPATETIEQLQLLLVQFCFCSCTWPEFDLGAPVSGETYKSFLERMIKDVVLRCFTEMFVESGARCPFLVPLCIGHQDPPGLLGVGAALSLCGAV